MVAGNQADVFLPGRSKLNTYEGVYFMDARLKDDDDLEKAVATVKAEIKRLGGTIRNEKPAERRTFAKPQQKQQGGYYMELLFDMDPANVAALRDRYRLDSNIFRVLIVTATEAALNLDARAPEAVGASATADE